MNTNVNIKDIGLEAHLNGSKAAHNNLGYDDFMKFVTVGDEFGEPLPITKLARLFRVSRLTVYKWLDHVPSDSNITVNKKG